MDTSSMLTLIVIVFVITCVVHVVSRFYELGQENDYEEQPNIQMYNESEFEEYVKGIVKTCMAELGENNEQTQESNKR